MGFSDRKTQMKTGWQLFHTPITSAQTDTAAGAVQHLHDHNVLMNDASLGYTARDFVDVSYFGSIRVMMFGRDTNNDTATLHLYGISSGGILERIGSVALVCGNVATLAIGDINGGQVLVAGTADPLVVTAFNDGNGWFACDTYTDTDTATELTVGPNYTDRPSWVDIDCNFGWNWIMPVVVFDGAQAVVAMGGIFRGLTRRNDIIHRF